MGLTTSHPALRWAVPGAVVAVVLAASGLTALVADATPTLPARSAAELLVDVQTANVAALSGTVVQTADLGLPELPVGMGGRGSADFTSLVSGSHTLRVWYSGEDQQRLALLGTMGESDIVRNGTDVWTWSSADNAATHYQLPARPDGKAEELLAESALPGSSAADSALAMTPQQAADAALAAIDPTTSVSTADNVKVADRDGYELVLTPKAATDGTESLIGEVRIAIDAEQHIPLRVQVFANGAGTPAFQVGFTKISFETPGPEQFEFAPPPGATVTDSTMQQADPDQPDPGAPAVPDELPAAGMGDEVAEPTVIGTGWTSILVASLPADPARLGDPAAPIDEAAPGDEPAPGAEPGAEPVPGEPESATPPGPDGADSAAAAGAELQSILGALPQVSGTWGSGRLLQSALFSVLLTDDGRVLGGAVAPEALYEAAGQ